MCHLPFFQKYLLQETTSAFEIRGFSISSAEFCQFQIFSTIISNICDFFGVSTEQSHHSCSDELYSAVSHCKLVIIAPYRVITPHRARTASKNNDKFNENFQRSQDATQMQLFAVFQFQISRYFIWTNRFGNQNRISFYPETIILSLANFNKKLKL